MRTDPTPDDGRNFFRGSWYAIAVSAALWAFLILAGFGLAWIVGRIAAELGGLMTVLGL